MKVIVKAKIETVSRYHCECPLPSRANSKLKVLGMEKIRLITKKYHAWYEGLDAKKLAGMAEMADASDLSSDVIYHVRVQVPLPAFSLFVW